MKGMVNLKELLLKKVSHIYALSSMTDEKESGLMSRSAPSAIASVVSDE
jgi:hypothetical protein